MSFEISGVFDRHKPCHYHKPEEVLNDLYLTPLQKKLVLEAMISEGLDSEGKQTFSGRFVEKIRKAKMSLQN